MCVFILSSFIRNSEIPVCILAFSLDRLVDLKSAHIMQYLSKIFSSLAFEGKQDTKNMMIFRLEFWNRRRATAEKKTTEKNLPRKQFLADVMSRYDIKILSILYPFIFSLWLLDDIWKIMLLCCYAGWKLNLLKHKICLVRLFFSFYHSAFHIYRST